MSDQELQERLEQALNEFPSLKNSAPDNWMVKAQVTVDKLMHFANTRKDHFRINEVL